MINTAQPDLSKSYGDKQNSQVKITADCCLTAEMFNRLQKCFNL